MELDQQYCIRSISWSRDPLSVKTKTMHFWKILLAQFSAVYLKSSEWNSRRKLEKDLTTVKEFQNLQGLQGLVWIRKTTQA